LMLTINVPGCGHLVLNYTLTQEIVATIIVDLNDEPSFNDEVLDGHAGEFTRLKGMSIAQIHAEGMALQASEGKPN
jgi:hypothetical protein